MVDILDPYLFSSDRNQTTSREFPKEELSKIASAIEGVPVEIFLDAESGHDLLAFDSQIADSLPEYEYEHAPASGRNPACKVWDDKDFDHSVDLYHPEERIAIEIEKSQRKRITDDLLKFIKGGQTYEGNRNRIEFGCLIVPINYRGSDNLFEGAKTALDFNRSIMHVEDVAVIGYADPRSE
jgi:hypothetical protein